MAKLIKCPTCQGTAIWGDENPHRPFCCERCRDIDLGAWANDDYKITSPIVDADDDSQSESGNKS